MNLEEINKIKEVMHPMPHTVQGDDYLSVALSLMESHNIRHLPVMQNGDVAGILSDRDVKLGLFVASRFTEDRPLLVEEVCNKHPYLVNPDEDLEVVALHMANQKIGSAVVVDEGKVLGIFTSTDACRWLGSYLQWRRTHEA